MDEDIRQRLKISPDRLDALNAVLLNPNMKVINDFLAVVSKYGTPEEINSKAAQARELPTLLKQIKETKPEYLADLEWLTEQRDQGAFISLANSRRQVLGD